MTGKKATPSGSFVSPEVKPCKGTDEINHTNVVNPSFQRESTNHSAVVSLTNRSASIFDDYCKGLRPKAKQELLELAACYPASHLPHRYLARLLYHEATSVKELNPHSAEKRVQLLREALKCASTATDLCPGSLSSAALRATLVVSLLVEESIASSDAAGSSKTPAYKNKSSEALKQEFKNAMMACNRALSSCQANSSELPGPSETISSSSQSSNNTSEPCTMEQILSWVKEERWEDISQEKRNVLASMQQVLESCHTLLDNTQIPSDGIVRLLQHILRPHKQELQVWASQLLLGKSLPPEDTQKKFENQAAVAELLKMLRPTKAEPLPEPKSSPPDTSTPCLSVDRDWEWEKDPSASSAAAAANAARRRNNKRGARAAGAVRRDRERYRSMSERYTDVEAFWRSIPPEKRRELLRVPLSPLLQVVKTESGPEAVEDVVEGIVLLRDQGNISARYWSCPVCEQKFVSGKDYLNHVEMFHEELAVSGGKYVVCCKCGAEVVGMYWANNSGPGYSLCFRCHATEGAGTYLQDGTPTFQKVYPRSTSAAPAWTDTSDFISTRDSFSSIEDEAEYPVSSSSPCQVHSPQQLTHTCLTPDFSNIPSSALHTLETITVETSSTLIPVLINPAPASFTKRAEGKETGEEGAENVQCGGTVSAPLLSPQAQQGLDCFGGSSWKGWWPKRLWRSGTDHAPDGPQDPTVVKSGSNVTTATCCDGNCSPLMHTITSCSAPASSYHSPAVYTPDPLIALSERRADSPRRSNSLDIPAGKPGAPFPLSLSEQLPSETATPDSPSFMSAGQSRAVSAQLPDTIPFLPDGQHYCGQHPWSDAAAQPSKRAAGGSYLQSLKLMESSGSSEPLVQEIMRRIRKVYTTDRETGDVTLGSVTQFAFRKLGSTGNVFDYTNLSEDAQGALDEFLMQPSIVFQQPDNLAAVLRILPVRDLHMVIAYVVRQHAEALHASGNGPETDAASAGSEVVGDDELSGEGDVGDDDSASETSSLGVGCTSLFHLVLEDEASFDRLLGQIWGDGEVAEDERRPDVSGFEQPPCKSPGAQGGGRSAKRRDRNSSPSIEEDPSLTSQTNHPDKTSSATSEPHLIIADWWRQHLEARALAEWRPCPDHYILRWVFGATVCREMEESVARQRDTRAGRERDVAVLELYEDVAGSWRQLQTYTDKRNKLEELRKRARHSFQVVKNIEEEGGHATLAQACEFLDAVLASYCSTQQTVPAQTGAAAPQPITLPGPQPSSLTLSPAVPSQPPVTTSTQLPKPNLTCAATAQPATLPGLQPPSLNPSSVATVQPPNISSMQLPRPDFMGAGIAQVPPTDCLDLSTTISGPSTPSRPSSPLFPPNPPPNCTFAPDTPTLGSPHPRKPGSRLSSSTSPGPHIDVQDQGEGFMSEGERTLSESMSAEAEGLCGDVGSFRPPTLYMCEAAVDVVRRYPQLAQEVSQRYARALLERELAVMELAEAMLCSEMEEAERDRMRCEEALRKARPELKDAEAEHSRVAAEGPASHRKRDLIDKATKEAEHRDRLNALAERIARLRDCSAAEEAGLAKYVARGAEAARDLAAVREQLRQHNLRKRNLDKVSAQLDVPVTPNEVPLTAVVEWRARRLECLMYRVLWVSEAVKMFQYSPHSGSRHYDLFLRATSWAKSLAEDFDNQIKGHFAELDKMKRRLSDVACVDQAPEIAGAALELIRRRIESAALQAKEEASLTLLKELEAEEAAAAARADGGNQGSGKKAGNNRKKANGEKSKAAKERTAALASSKKEEEEARKRVEEVEREQFRQAREVAIEAELEKRRRELEEMEVALEVEAIRVAQEASLTDVPVADSHETCTVEADCSLTDLATTDLAKSSSRSGELSRTSSLMSSPEKNGQPKRPAAAYAASSPGNNCSRGRLASNMGSEDFITDEELDSATRAAIEASLRDLELHALYAYNNKGPANSPSSCEKMKRNVRKTFGPGSTVATDIRNVPRRSANAAIQSPTSPTANALPNDGNPKSNVSTPNQTRTTPTGVPRISALRAPINVTVPAAAAAAVAAATAGVLPPPAQSLSQPAVNMRQNSIIPPAPPRFSAPKTVAPPTGSAPRLVNQANGSAPGPFIPPAPPPPRNPPAAAQPAPTGQSPLPGAAQPAAVSGQAAALPSTRAPSWSAVLSGQISSQEVPIPPKANQPPAEQSKPSQSGSDPSKGAPLAMPLHPGPGHQCGNIPPPPPRVPPVPPLPCIDSKPEVTLKTLQSTVNAADATSLQVKSARLSEREVTKSKNLSSHMSAGPAFDPFAENPLLKALCLERLDPGKGNGSQPEVAPTALSSGAVTPLMVSPRGNVSQQSVQTLSPPPIKPTQEPDHIASIMSILEPEAYRSLPSTPSTAQKVMPLPPFASGPFSPGVPRAQIPHIFTSEAQGVLPMPSPPSPLVIPRSAPSAPVSPIGAYPANAAGMSMEAPVYMANPKMQNFPLNMAMLPPAGINPGSGLHPARGISTWENWASTLVPQVPSAGGARVMTRPVLPLFPMGQGAVWQQGGRNSSGQVTGSHWPNPDAPPFQEPQRQRTMSTREQDVRNILYGDASVAANASNQLPQYGMHAPYAFHNQRPSLQHAGVNGIKTAQPPLVLGPMGHTQSQPPSARVLPGGSALWGDLGLPGTEQLSASAVQVPAVPAAAPPPSTQASKAVATPRYGVGLFSGDAVNWSHRASPSSSWFSDGWSHTSTGGQ